MLCTMHSALRSALRSSPVSRTTTQLLGRINIGATQNLLPSFNKINALSTVPQSQGQLQQQSLRYHSSLSRGGRNDPCSRHSTIMSRSKSFGRHSNLYGNSSRSMSTMPPDNDDDDYFFIIAVMMFALAATSRGNSHNMFLMLGMLFFLFSL